MRDVRMAHSAGLSSEAFFCQGEKEEVGAQRVKKVRVEITYII